VDFALRGSARSFVTVAVCVVLHVVVVHSFPHGYGCTFTFTVAFPTFGCCRSRCACLPSFPFALRLRTLRLQLFTVGYGLYAFTAHVGYVAHVLRWFTFTVCVWLPYTFTLHRVRRWTFTVPFPVLTFSVAVDVCSFSVVVTVYCCYCLPHTFVWLLPVTRLRLRLPRCYVYVGYAFGSFTFVTRCVFVCCSVFHVATYVYVYACVRLLLVGYTCTFISFVDCCPVDTFVVLRFVDLR